MHALPCSAYGGGVSLTAKAPKPKPKRCKNPACRQPFPPVNSLQTVCGYKCGLAWAEIQRKRKEAQLAREDRRHTRERKEKLKTRADYMREAQAEVNAYVRLRDAHLGCVSCDKPATWQGQWHASHFRSVGSSPHLRFDLRNIHKACSVCNNHLSGNIHGYRPKLIERIGLEAVEALETDQEPRRYTIDDLQAIKAEYRAKVRELKKKLDE